jgi:hypothetical protein
MVISNFELASLVFTYSKLVENLLPNVKKTTSHR